VLDKPSLSGAVRRLVELGLASGHPSAARMKKAMEASEMAGQEIDRLDDPSATDEERQRRKGPKEFRDIDGRSALGDQHLWEPSNIGIGHGVINAGHDTHFIPFWNVSGSRCCRARQSSLANSGSALSGTRRVHPVIVGCSTANPSPSMIMTAAAWWVVKA
jgi:hypothetical protein